MFEVSLWREEGPPGTCWIRTQPPVWICFGAPLQCCDRPFFPLTRVDADQMSEPFKSPSRPPGEPEIHLCSTLLPEPLSDLFTLRVKPRVLRAAERICSFTVQAQDKDGKVELSQRNRAVASNIYIIGGKTVYVRKKRILLQTTGINVDVVSCLLSTWLASSRKGRIGEQVNRGDES